MSEPDKDKIAGTLLFVIALMAKDMDGSLSGEDVTDILFQTGEKFIENVIAMRAQKTPSEDRV